MSTIFSQIGNVVSTAMNTLITQVNGLNTEVTDLTNTSTTLAKSDLSNVTSITNLPTTVLDDLKSTVTNGTTIAVKPDSWHLFRSAAIDYVSDSIVDFNYNTFVGSTVTEAGGRITVSKDGMYIIACSLSRHGSDDGTLDYSFRKNGVVIYGTRMYVSGASTGNYDSQTAVIAYPFNAGDIIDVWGYGYMYGSTTESMSFFSGTRIGDI